MLEFLIVGILLNVIVLVLDMILVFVIMMLVPALLGFVNNGEFIKLVKKLNDTNSKYIGLKNKLVDSNIYKLEYSYWLIKLIIPYLYSYYSFKKLLVHSIDIGASSNSNPITSYIEGLIIWIERECYEIEQLLDE